jgi:hypothetical protein
MDPELSGFALGLLFGAAKVMTLGTIGFGIAWWRARRRLRELTRRQESSSAAVDAERLDRLEQGVEYLASQLDRLVTGQEALARRLDAPDTGRAFLTGGAASDHGSTRAVEPHTPA